MSNATKLPNEKRTENYIRQNLQHRGKAALSNRQLRRLKRHDNLQKIQEVAKATFKADEEKPAPTEPEVTLSAEVRDVMDRFNKEVEAGEWDEHNIPESEMNEIIESLEAPTEPSEITHDVMDCPDPDGCMRPHIIQPAEKRPCGGTDHCVTPSGAKAKSTHKKCKAFA